MDWGVQIAATSGAFDRHDAVQFITSGAQIIEMCSAVIIYGYEWLSKQVRRLEKWLDEKGYESLADIYGTSADSALT